MKLSTVLSCGATGLLLTCAFPVGAAESPPTAPAVQKWDRANLDKLTAGWPNRPKLALNQMIAKYGEPQEATAMTVIWHNAGPYKRITLNNVETPHDFPKPHVDFLQHTLSMKVPAAKADELVQFDGSNTFSRTEGEISARCDSEAHNILTLNLIHDILGGKKTVAEARKAFDQSVVEDMAGKEVPYMKALQFDATEATGPDPDKVSIPGAPLPMTKGKETTADSEVLCVIAAVDENEILAAEEAEMRKLSPEVLEFAKMMHTEHGANIAELMKLGKKVEAQPIETAKTDALRVKGAGELASLVPLDDAAFGKAYVDAMVAGHTEVLAMIDGDLLKSAEHAEVKQFLTETREHVAMHLEHAKKLQGATASR